ncbi:MAG TPA: hypothetical protein VNI78_01315 [Vicinamibacterales bacterium]|nr:hypothetical protein [Vicinamibacterales bacterium]
MRWGVEAELVVASEIESSRRPQIMPLGIEVLTLTGGAVGVPSSGSVSEVVGIPIPRSCEIRTEQRTMTFSTAAWVRQELGARAALVYLGGITFARVTRDTDDPSTVARPGRQLRDRASCRLRGARQSDRSRAVRAGRPDTECQWRMVDTPRRRPGLGFLKSKPALI